MGKLFSQPKVLLLLWEIQRRKFQEDIYLLIQNSDRRVLKSDLQLRPQQASDGWGLQKLYATVGFEASDVQVPYKNELADIGAESKAVHKYIDAYVASEKKNTLSSYLALD